MGTALVMAIMAVAMMLWNREIRWKDLTLGLASMMLLGFSLSLRNDLRTADRNAIRPSVSNWLTRMTYQSNQLHRKLSESVCQPKAETKTTDRYQESLLGDSYQVSVLASAVKEAVEPLLGTTSSPEK
jgi:hypothetical protein